MRIGLVTGEYPPMQGGIGAHCQILAATMTEAGHTVAIFTDEQAHESDARIALTHKSGKWRYRTLKSINAWAQRENLDIVNLHYQTAAYQMSPWIHFMPDFLKSAPVVTTFHDLRFPYLFPKAGRIRDWIVKRLAKASAGVITTNHEDHRQLPNAALIPIGSSVHTQLPVNYDRSIWRSQAGATDNDLLVAHFGFINHSKGVETLLNAVGMLVKAGQPIHLVMIGGRTGSSDPTNAAYVKQIDAQIAQLGLQDRVCWTGFVDDITVSAYFTAADVIALPFVDGASYRRSSLMAAIAHECAILTTKPNVAIPTFKNGENLMVVASERALTAALQVLHKSPQLRDQLRVGAKTLKQEFDWNTITDANLAFFEQLLDSRRRLIKPS